MKIIVFDTNVLTHIYSYTRESIKDIVYSLSSLEPKNKIVITDTVYTEFLRHYHVSRSRSGDKYPISIFKRNFQTFKSSFINKIEKIRPIRLSDIYNTDIDDIIDKLKSDCDSYLISIQRKLNELETNVGDDEIDDENDVLKLFVENHKISGFTMEEKLNLVPTCEIRFANKIKPGLTDQAKNDYPFQKYGDVFIWYEILKIIGPEDDLVFVENETKDDWWDNYESKIIAQSLIEEFEQKSNGTIKMLTFEDFYTEYLEEESKAETTVEVQKIRAELNKYLNSAKVLHSLEVFLYDNISENNIENILLGENIAGGNISEVTDIEITKIDIPKDSFTQSYDTYDSTLNVNCKCIVFVKCNVTSDYGNSGFPANIEISAKIYFNVLAVCDLLVSHNSVNATINDAKPKFSNYVIYEEKNYTYGYDEEAEIGLYGNCTECSCPINDENYGDGTLCHHCLMLKDE